MHRVKEESVYQRECTAPMHTYRGVHKKMRNLDMSVGGMHRYCAYRTGNAQKIKAFVQTINGSKDESR